MRATAKIWGARASEQSFKFCEKIEQKGKFCEQLKILMYHMHSSPLIEQLGEDGSSSQQPVKREQKSSRGKSFWGIFNRSQ